MMLLHSHDLEYKQIGGMLVRNGNDCLEWRCPKCGTTGESKHYIATCPECKGEKE